MRTIPRTAVVLLVALGAAGVGRPLKAQPHVQPDRTGGGARTVDTSVFAPLSLDPFPGDKRLASGAPGPKYWQNRADYDLKVELKGKIAHGSMVLRYTNNSPTPLKTLHFQFEAHPEVVDSVVQVVDGRRVALAVPVSKDQPSHGLEALYAALLAPVGKGKEAIVKNAFPGSDVSLAAPIQPGQTATFYVTWRFFSVPLSEKPLRGSESPLPYDVHVASQWFPRVSVYDDVAGWNTEFFDQQDHTGPFSIRGEDPTVQQNFLEYGDYTLEVTVPASYIVTATGVLDNPGDVLPPAVQGRLTAAAKSDTVVHVVTAADLASGAARPKREGTLTWKFHAQNVRDMVWCAAPTFQWDATNWNGKLVQAYYWAQGGGTAWPQAATMTKTALQEYSERWFPYPYPQFSAVQTKGGLGVEYPMLALAANFMNPEPLYNVLSHVVAHNWFPMLVGSNERTHPWMDEGFATFMSTFGYTRYYPRGTDQAMQVRRFFLQVEEMMQAAAPVEADGSTDVTIENNAEEATENRGYADYVKTAAGLQLLRQEILGPEKFDKALRTYIERWAYKHPTPADFFRTMADASGQQLDWFWREWFLTRTAFDQAIEAVTQTTQGGENHVSVTYVNRKPGVLPILARVTFSDGTTQDVSAPADVWRANPARYVASYTFPNKQVTRIELDPDHRLVDINRDNNVWKAP